VNTERIEAIVRDSAETIDGLRKQAGKIAGIAEAVIGALSAGHKILTAGNGGSAAAALHMSEELVGRFRTDRRALPAVSLAADPTALTCIANDFGFDFVFSRQVEALGLPGDLLILFSTSGEGANLEKALEAAETKGVAAICLLGRDGGRLAGRGAYEVIVPGTATERIQEAHQVILHAVLDAVESAFG